MPMSRHFKALELDKILALCATHAVSPQAKEMALQLRPAATFGEAEGLLEDTKAASSLTTRFGNPAFYILTPPQEALKRADLGAMLSPKELLGVGKVLLAARTLAKWYREATGEPTPLDALFHQLRPNEELEKNISRVVLSEDEIADNASSELSSIRRNIRGAHQRARDVLDRMVRSTTTQKFLQEQIITIRNGRFVLPVRAEYRQEVPGLVHDTSASGSTYFIEPMTVVELNNKIKELEGAQQAEINRILLDLSAQAGGDKGNILESYALTLALDVLFAKCKLGDRLKGVPPTLVEKGETNLHKARHPLIPPDQIVPIDIYIGGDFDTLVVTGPNTGGKTVALKTIGLLTLMASCGFLIPAGSRSRVRFYPKVLADIGDEQSIEQSLSTFSGHMTNIVSILKAADDQSLVLIDELGAGTDPVEGAALAVSIAVQLRRQKATLVATTHYAEMKVFALQTEGVENASCEFDVATLRPTYRLLIGTPGRSNAFAISSRLGLPDAVIQGAQDFVSSENRRFEEVVSNLEATRQELEQERKQAQSLRQQAADDKKTAQETKQQAHQSGEKIIQDAHSQARSLLERVRYQSDQILEQLQSLKKEQEKAGFSQDVAAGQSRVRRLLGQLEKDAIPVRQQGADYTLPRPLRQGDTVFLLDFNTEGLVLSTPDNQDNVRVQAGILETKVPLTSLRLLDKPKPKVTINGGSVRTQRASPTAQNGAGAGKLDLRGLDSSEATLELLRFIDQSVLRGLNILTIVHGKGTGVLRELVTFELHRHPQIAQHRLGGYGEGGDGVTIAELK